MRMAARLQAMKHTAYEGTVRKSGGRPKWTGRVHLNEAALGIPLKWRAPRKIFVNSMSDLFQDAVPADFIARVWDVMVRAERHVFQILTKRPENMLRVVKGMNLAVRPNIWLGTSVESAKYKTRIELLRQTPAAIRFISFEPLLSGVGRTNLSGIHWAIVGGESGPGARPMKAEWVDNIERDCRRYDVKFFFKQWGGVNKKAAGRKYRNRTWDEYPEAVAAPLV
jgi:protein gp37